MNIAQTASETTEVKVKTPTKTIYVNMKLAELTTDINSGDLVHQFNGNGRKIALIPDCKESLYLSYSSDEAGIHIEPQPFTINNGERIKFKLQVATGDTSKATCKWKGITQDSYDLRSVPKKKSTYTAVVAETTEPTSETDKVFIKISITLKDEVTLKVEKFSVSWDPAVIIVRG